MYPFPTEALSSIFVMIGIRSEWKVLSRVCRRGIPSLRCIPGFVFLLGGKLSIIWVSILLIVVATKHFGEVMACTRNTLRFISYALASALRLT